MCIKILDKCQVNEGGFWGGFVVKCRYYDTGGVYQAKKIFGLEHR